MKHLDEREEEWAEEAQEARRSAAFIQFPLALLALFDERHKLMENALNYGIVNYARNTYRWNRRNDEFQRDLARWEPKPEPPDYDGSNKHKTIAAAQANLGVKASVKYQIESWKEIRQQLKELDVDPDAAILVRIPVKRAFRLRGEWGYLNDNDVRVLLAITSKLGDKEYTRMTRQEIAIRATGSKDEDQWRGWDRLPLLTANQIAWSIAKLAEERKLISRVACPGGRGSLNFFSLKLHPDELLEKAKQWRAQQKKLKKQRRHRPLRVE